MSRVRSFPVSLTLLLLLALPLGALPALGALSYESPSPELAAIVDAPPTPRVHVGPRREWILIVTSPGWPSIDELAEPELRLAGDRIRPRTDGPSRSGPASGLELVRIADGERRAVTGLPETPRIDDLSWSPDGRHVAFTQTRSDGIEPWVLEVATGRARQLAPVRLSLTADVAPTWLPDSSGLLALLVPADRGPEPEAPEVPIGPVVEETAGREAPARTYQDLLQDPHDEALFEHFFTTRLARIGLDGTVERIGEKGIFWDLSPSPSGEYLLVEILHRPYSYRVPATRFPRRIEVWSTDGGLVHQVADLPLQEEVPMAFGSVPTGPRSVHWRADAPDSLAWVEALDGGDALRPSEERDRTFLQSAPFDEPPRPLLTLGLRLAGVSWGSDDVALVREVWRKTRQVRTWRVSPGGADPQPGLLFDRSYEDRYSDPGTPELRRNEAGRLVLDLGPRGTSLFLTGSGASDEGDRPFFDVLDLETGTTERRFRSAGPTYEIPIAPLDERGERLLVRRESPEDPPDYFVRDLGSGDLRRLTSFPHPTPQLVGLEKRLLRYTRDDGVELTGTLYTPPGYDAERDGRLPLLVWAYPREYKSADAAGQVRDSPHRFDRISAWSPLVWLARGYAVLDDPAMPIVGEGEEEPNDTYVPQLVASARAAIEAAAGTGIADPERVAIGGHSYGAFMTANLLAHSDLFAAGIARSGAYNRTLTPFGFQAEERSLWEAPEIYFQMSPFMHADKIEEPILLIHGEVDNNSGTFPLQSRRFYAALKGHGATARLVMLPHESHGYRARESILHMLWETERWLETYVRDPAALTESSSGAQSTTTGVR